MAAEARIAAIFVCFSNSSRIFAHNFWPKAQMLLQVVLSTHAIGGLSQFDAILAAKIDALPVTYSPKWLQQQS